MPTPEENMNAWEGKIGPSTRSFKESEPKGSGVGGRGTTNVRPTTKTAKTGTESTAALAAEALVGINTALSMTLLVLNMPQTSLAISSENDAFKERAYAALKTDPALCARILKLSSTSGMLGLLGAYAMLAVSVAPSAIAEKDNVKNLVGAFRKKDKDAPSN